MTDHSPGTAGGVFSGAARASQYVEEETVGARPMSRAREKQPARLISPPPATETEPDAERAEVARLTPLPASIKAPAAEPTPPPRDSTSVLFGGSTPSVTEDPGKATSGVRGMLANLGLPIKPSVAELEARKHAEQLSAWESTVRQATWTRAVSILVNNPKGGTGKTPTALVLAGVLASIRGGSTAVLEVSDDPGALSYRAEGSPRLGVGELVRDVDQIKTAGRLHGYTAPQTSFADVIGSTGRRDRLTGEAVVAASRVIDEFYKIRVMDSGNQPTSSAFQGAVSVADILVIPVVNAGDSVLEAIQLLEELREAGPGPKQLADNAIAIRLTDGRPENKAVAEEVARLLNEAGVKSLHEIPYDPHIAERQQITLAKLSPATRNAFVAAAAAVVSSLKTTVSTEN